MGRPKLLIADDSEDFTLALAQLLEEEFEIRCSQNGKETLTLLHSFQPDLLVLELMITELDGISLLQAAVDAGLRPNVLAVTRFYNDYTANLMGPLGIRYAIRKPCDLHATAARIRDLIHAPCQHSQAIDPRAQVTALLHALGFPAKLHGYAYLREAILEMARNPSQSITKELYPTVAVICGCTRGQVERSIRTAIASAWNKRDEQAWRKYLRTDPGSPLDRPTNGEFIIRLSEVIQPP